MRRATTQTILGLLGVGILVVGLSGPAMGQGAPPAGPFQDIQATLGIILDRLDDLEDKLDDQITQATDLRGVTQNWDKQLDASNGDADGCNSDRFTCLWGDTVVRDNETGLVWERSPDPDSHSWASAINHCARRAVGDRRGWSLPLREQLASLLVYVGELRSRLPTDHPFLNVGSSRFWSATTWTTNPKIAESLEFNGGTGGGDDKILSGLRVWCVRGGQVFDGNTHDTLH